MDAKQAAQTSLQKQVDNNGAATLNQDATDFRSELEKMLPRLAEASLRGMKPEFLMSSALSLIRSNEALRKCDKPSILSGIMQAALLGLRLDPVLGQCCLVPRKGKAQFMMMYKGIVLLAHRSGKVKDVEAQVVYEHDTFEIEYGSHRSLTHKPAKGERGTALGAYGFVSTTNGGEFFEYLTKKEIETIRDKGGYDPQRSSPWKSDTFAMWEKTSIKQALRLVPTDDPALSTAVALDDLESRGYDQRLEIIEGKLTHAEFSDADPEVPGNAVEETKRLTASQPVEQSPELLALLGPPAAPVVTHGELETDAEREARLAGVASDPRPVQTWAEQCLSVIGMMVKNGNTDARKIAGEWYSAGQKKVTAGEVTRAEFDKIDKQFREWFPPKPIGAPQLSLLDPPAQAPALVTPTAPSVPAEPKKPAPLVQSGAGIKATKQPKDADKEAEEYELLVGEIAKADKIPAIMAVMSKIKTSSVLGDSAKKGLGQIAQDRFAAIKAQVRK